MSEYLAFNKGGQWELHKATGPDRVPPKSDYKPGSATYATRTQTNLDGNLPKDLGRKGTLHDHGGGQVPKGGRVDIKQVVKPARQMQSQHNARNPGVGD